MEKCTTKIRNSLKMPKAHQTATAVISEQVHVAKGNSENRPTEKRNKVLKALMDTVPTESLLGNPSGYTFIDVIPVKLIKSSSQCKPIS